MNNELLSRRDLPAQSPYLPYEEIEVAEERGSEIHLREYVHRVYRHKTIVFFVTLLLTTVAGLYLFQQPNLFRAQARVEVDVEREVGTDGTRKTITPFDDRAYFNTQLELLESPSLIQRVIKKLDLTNDPNFVSDQFIEESKPGWKLDRLTHFVTGRPTQTETQPLEETEKYHEAVKAIQAGLSVDPVVQPRQTFKDTRLISVAFSHPKPQIAMSVANAIAEDLVSSNLKNKMSVNINESDYLETNISDLQAQIRGDEQKLLDYGRNYQLPQDNTQNTVVDRLVGLNRQLLEAENVRKLAEAEYRTSQSPVAVAALAEIATKQISDIDIKLDDLRQRRAQLLVEATEKYPEVIEVDKQIAVLETQARDRRSRATNLYKTNLDTKYREAVAREDAIRRAFNEQRGQMFGQNEASINYRIVQQSLETNKLLLADMTKRVKENEMLKAKAPNNIRVIDYAMTPNEPIDAKRFPYLGLAFLLSLTTGVGLALFRDYFDDSVHTTEEVEEALNLPALAVIPKVGSGTFKYRQITASSPMTSISESSLMEQPASDGKPELLFNTDPQSPLAEAFRRLRTALLLSPSVGDLKKILVTSSQQGEGKTTTAVNVAASLMQTGAKVLIIDADMRSPRMHKIFNLSNDEGLSNIFTRDIDPSELFSRLVQQTHGLYVITGGAEPINSAECLGSDRMTDLLSLCDPIFDYIVIDSPPVIDFVDSTILGAMADGVLLVVEGNRSSREMVKYSTKVLRMVGAKVVGIVLNKISVPSRAYYYRNNN